MSASNADWSEMWVWRAASRRVETARMAILAPDHLFITGPLDRRRIADLYEAAHLGSERIDSVMQATDTADESMKLPRATISAVNWHRSTRMIEIERTGLETIRLHCAESESTEEIGRGLQRGLAPSQLPISAPVPRTEMITFELTKGKGRVPLLVFIAGLVVAVACFALSLLWVGLLAAAVAAVALVGVASVIRDADLSVPYYRVEVDRGGDDDHDPDRDDPDDEHHHDGDLDAAEDDHDPGDAHDDLVDVTDHNIDDAGGSDANGDANDELALIDDETSPELR